LKGTTYDPANSADITE